MIIESGVGTGNRLAVFDEKIREWEVQVPATNHISTESLGITGTTGVFTVSNVGSFGSFVQIILSITNNDPVNLMIIDRVYVQVITCAINLPDTSITMGIGHGTGFNNLSNIKNENIFSTLIPLITEYGSAGTGSTININTIFPIIGELIDLLPQGSNGHILRGSRPIPSKNNTNESNTFAIFINPNGHSTFLQAFIRFMMVPPGELG